MLTISLTGQTSGIEVYFCKFKNVDGKLDFGVAFVDFTGKKLGS